MELNIYVIESYSEHRFFFIHILNSGRAKWSFTSGIWKQKDLTDWTAVLLLSPEMRICHFWAFFSPFQCQGGMPEGNDTHVTQIQNRAPCFETLNFPIEILPAPLLSCSVHDTAKTCLFHMLWITFANRQRSAFESNIQHFSSRMGFSKLWEQFIYPLTIRVG